MKSKKYKPFAITFYTVIIALALILPNMAFAQQSGDFTYTVSGGTVTITKYTGTGGNVVIPSAIDGMPVVHIGDLAFFLCTGLTSVTIPDSVTSIGQQAFWFCSGLTSVTIGNSVTSIGFEAFSDCTHLTSVTIPDSVTSIADYAFSSCMGLISVTIGNSVTSIGNWAFSDCFALTSVTIGNSVMSIGYAAFRNCYHLTSVTIPNSVKSILATSFSHCTGLTSVTIGNSVTSIGDYAFIGCAGLTRAYFLGNAPSMGTDVFYDCASNFSICYTAGSTGFTTPTWNDYPAKVCENTLIKLASFTATPKSGKVILLWTTETETDNAGFNIYRSETETGEYAKANDSLIPAQGSSTEGASYEFVDKEVKNRKTYYYKLEDFDLNGTSTMHGPVSATPRWILGIFRK